MQYKKIRIHDILGQFLVNKILYACEKDMKKYDFYHWNSETIKKVIIPEY